MLGVWYTQALNFLAFVFSPLRILSAPTFFPLLGHPLFCEHARKKDRMIGKVIQELSLNQLL